MLPEARQNVFLLRYRSDIDAGDETAHLRAALDPLPTRPSGEPREVQALSDISGLPAVLGGVLVLLAAATLAHTLISSVRRRRRELAVLRTMGFVRRQVWFSVFWQTATLVGDRACSSASRSARCSAASRGTCSPRTWARSRAAGRMAAVRCCSIPAAFVLAGLRGRGARVARGTHAPVRRAFVPSDPSRQAVTSSSMRASVLSMFSAVFLPPRATSGLLRLASWEMSQVSRTSVPPSTGSSS